MCVSPALAREIHQQKPGFHYKSRRPEKAGRKAFFFFLKGCIERWCLLKPTLTRRAPTCHVARPSLGHADASPSEQWAMMRQTPARRRRTLHTRAVAVPYCGTPHIALGSPRWSA